MGSWVLWLQERYGATIHQGTAEEDFFFMSSAKTLLLSPSTFAWWAAFLSSNETVVHFPLMPMDIPMPWCNLLVRFSNMAERFVYHDWYLLRSINFEAV
jgi:hypothetical protein